VTPLTLVLLDGRQVTQLDDVVSLVATDGSGQFGVQAGHVALVTVLEPGLFRYRRVSRPAWTYGACVGGLLACLGHGDHTEVRIVSSRFLNGEQPEALQTALDAVLEQESSLRISTRESQLQLELALARRMQQLAQTTNP
jgi:F0F1-type ATP synthase epsilon subunit